MIFIFGFVSPLLLPLIGLIIFLLQGGGEPPPGFVIKNVVVSRLKPLMLKKNAPFPDDWKRTRNKILNLFVSFQFRSIKNVFGDSLKDCMYFKSKKMLVFHTNHKY